MIDLSAGNQQTIAEVSGDTITVVNETRTSHLFNMSFEEQQEVLFATLQSFQEND